MKKIISRHIHHWTKKDFIFSVAIGLTLLFSSLAANYYSSNYAQRREGNSVQDIILDNVRVRDVDFFVVEGASLLILFVIFLLLSEPKKIPFTLKSAALFVFIRSAFIVLTHIGPDPDQYIINASEFYRGIGVGSTGGLFFSGHTGMPFLMALIFWKEKTLRVFFILCSAFFGIIVLLGHLHYSIDVFSAFFITYTIFHISQWLFKRDYKLFSSKEELPELEKTKSLI